MKQDYQKQVTRMASIRLSVFATLFLAVQLFAGGDKYTVDQVHSYVGFSVKHLMISTTKGHFTGFEGSITVEGNKVVSAEGSVKTSTINTNNEKRDAHLKGPDFFETEKYPEISFKTIKISKKGKGYIAKGKFTMHGVTKEVEVPFTFAGPIKNPWGKYVIAGDANFSINRKDYGLTWNKAMDNGGVVVGEKVNIELHIEAIKG